MFEPSAIAALELMTKFKIGAYRTASDIQDRLRDAQWVKQTYYQPVKGQSINS